MAKKEKNYGDCHVCQKPLDKHHLQKGSVRVCSYECCDKHSDQKKQAEKLEQ